MTNQHHRLYRNQNNKVIAGVCSGLGEYLNIDVTIVRLVWILFTFLGGAGIFAYIIACFIIPRNPNETGGTAPPHSNDYTAVRVFGFLFIGAGIVILLDNLDILSFHHWWNMTEDFIFPGLLILAGIFFLTRRKGISTPGTPKETAGPGEPPPPDQPAHAEPSAGEQQQKKVLHRSVIDKKLFGICGGVGEYFEIDPTIIRIAYVVFTLFSGGAGILIYLLMYFIIPEGQQSLKTQS